MGKMYIAHGQFLLSYPVLYFLGSVVYVCVVCTVGMLALNRAGCAVATLCGQGVNLYHRGRQEEGETREEGERGEDRRWRRVGGPRPWGW